MIYIEGIGNKIIPLPFHNFYFFKYKKASQTFFWLLKKPRYGAIPKICSQTNTYKTILWLKIKNLEVFPLKYWQCIQRDLNLTFWQLFKISHKLLEKIDNI